MEEDNFAIEKLVEFGFSMAIAQQMIQTLNNTLVQSHFNFQSKSIENQQHNSYFVLLDNVQSGPFSEKELIELIGLKKLRKDTLVWRRGIPNWVRVELLPEILKLIILSDQINLK